MHVRVPAWLRGGIAVTTRACFYLALSGLLPLPPARLRRVRATRALMDFCRHPPIQAAIASLSPPLQSYDDHLMTAASGVTPAVVTHPTDQEETAALEAWPRHLPLHSILASLTELSIS